MYDISHHSPEDELVLFSYGDWFVLFVVWNEADITFILSAEVNTLDCELIVQTTYSNTVVKWFQASVNNEQVAFIDFWCHRVTDHLCIKRGSWVLDEFLVQIQYTINIILCR